MKFWLDMPLRIVCVLVAVLAILVVRSERRERVSQEYEAQHWKSAYIDLADDHGIALGPGLVPIEVPNEPETYKHLFGCKNCGHKWDEQISKGVKLPRCADCPACSLDEGVPLVSGNVTWR